MFSLDCSDLWMVKCERFLSRRRQLRSHRWIVGDLGIARVSIHREIIAGYFHTNWHEWNRSILHEKTPRLGRFSRSSCSVGNLVFHSDDKMTRNALFFAHVAMPEVLNCFWPMTVFIVSIIQQQQHGNWNRMRFRTHKWPAAFCGNQKPF